MSSLLYWRVSVKSSLSLPGIPQVTLIIEQRSFNLQTIHILAVASLMHKMLDHDYLASLGTFIDVSQALPVSVFLCLKQSFEHGKYNSAIWSDAEYEVSTIVKILETTTLLGLKGLARLVFAELQRECLNDTFYKDDTSAMLKAADSQNKLSCMSAYVRLLFHPDTHLNSRHRIQARREFWQAFYTYPDFRMMVRQSFYRICGIKSAYYRKRK